MDKTTRIRTILGAGLWWAWMDSLFAGVFFAATESQQFSQLVLGGISLCGAIACMAFLRKSGRFTQAVSSPLTVGIASACATIASVLFIASAGLDEPALAAAGVVLGSVYTTFAVPSWGALYCSTKGDETVELIAASFAMSCCIDIVIMLMSSAVVSWAATLFPLLSFIAWRSIPTNAKNAIRKTRQEFGSPSDGSEQTLSERLFDLFGITPIAMAGLALILFGFGYMQPFMASAQETSVLDSGTVMVVSRGVAAAMLLLVAHFSPKRGEAFFKLGFLVIVAGFSLMPFLANAGLLQISGGIIMAGYTISDIFIWVLVVRACAASKEEPLKTIAIARQIVNGLCIFLGMIIGYSLQAATSSFIFPHSDSIAIGYLATVATMLIIGNKDVWLLFESSHPIAAQKGTNLDDRLDALAHSWSLTQREREIFKYVATGRSQPWIAETLGIAESTAKTHIRHIYQKADVTGKQELIDKVTGE